MRKKMTSNASIAQPKTPTNHHHIVPSLLQSRPQEGEKETAGTQKENRTKSDNTNRKKNHLRNSKQEKGLGKWRRMRWREKLLKEERQEIILWQCLLQSRGRLEQWEEVGLMLILKGRSKVTYNPWHFGNSDSSNSTADNAFSTPRTWD